MARNQGRNQGYSEARQSQSIELGRYKRAFEIVCDRLGLSAEERAAILREARPA